MATKSEFGRWVQFRSPKARPEARLVCFPFAGGGASQYASWKNAVGEKIEVVPIQLPGRENRMKDDFMTDPDQLVAQTAKQLVPLLSETPFFLFGHSMGGLLAYKFALVLEQSFDLTAEALYISATSLEPDFAKAQISNLPEKEFLREVDRYGGLERELWEFPEYLDLYINILRNDFKLIENYRLGENTKINAPIRVYYGTDDEMVGKEQAKIWKEHTRSQFSTREIQGGHFFLKTKKEEVCLDLKDSMEKAMDVYKEKGRNEKR